MPDVFLKNGEFRLELFFGRLHRVELIVEHMDLAVFLDALEHDLFEILIAFL